MPIPIEPAVGLELADGNASNRQRFADIFVQLGKPSLLRISNG